MIEPDLPSETVLGIVEAMVRRLIPPDAPPLNAAAREAVERDVTRYVAEQIERMPDFLRHPYHLALHGFEWLAAVRYGRRFTALPSPQQARYLQSWGSAPLGPMRDLVKLIRSTSLLAYFDHPTVAAQLAASTPPAPVTPP